MTKMQRLQQENEQMKKALKEIYAMCTMTPAEKEEYLKEFEHADPQFYPLAVGAIESMAKDALTIVGIEM